MKPNPIHKLGWILAYIGGGFALLYEITDVYFNIVIALTLLVTGVVIAMCNDEFKED